MAMSSGNLSGVHQTAFRAGALRAGHLLDDNEPKIFRDEFEGSAVPIIERQ
ncbi:hypothetical protein SAMN05444678_11163 [Sphingomonas sp. YR710]|nr:hypothetical protein SAMN05444678_11163 [Sphingomonas sp. YR710]